MAISPELKTTLGMLEILTLRPRALKAEDMAALFDAGVSQSGIEHAVLVCFMFAMQNRIVAALDWDLVDEEIRQARQAMDRASQDQLRFHKGRTAEAAYNGTVPAEVQALSYALCNGPGLVDAGIRTAVEARSAALTGAERPEELIDEVPAELQYYVDLIAVSVEEITDEMVADIINAGWQEEEIYEITIAAAAGAGLARLEMAWKILEQL